jgi:ribosomal protein L37E
MKLFEVLYPKCKKCGYDFSKGGRDHRVGLCDVCAFPNSDKAKKAKRKVKEAAVDQFTSQVEEVLWRDYQDDPMFPVGVEFPVELDDEDYLDFSEHVGDIVKYARQHHIRNPKVAVYTYAAGIERKMQQEHPLH